MVTMQSAFGRRVNNPFPYSDLYEMRMQRVKHSACKFGKDFDFFGNSNPTGLPNYRGSIRDNRRYDYIKMDTLARYKFCLCM
jgi:hypothetical protein